MKVKKLVFVALLLFSVKSFAQIWDKIETKDGIHYITSNLEYIKFPLLGTYLFQGKEPVVELNQYGAGFYQLHEQLKRPVNWGIECDVYGSLLYKKGFDNSKYTLWYQYTAKSEDDTEEDMNWKPVDFTIHFNTLKMFIQGERSKDYKEIPEK
ncbi:MAG: hypothetical protein ABIQ27_12990 [Flavobacterium sp.]|uniref:hypothetical protein n=1 Tax=Flavobacterium sp. TaxID=239 RepID=UPI003263A42C